MVRYSFTGQLFARVCWQVKCREGMILTPTTDIMVPARLESIPRISSEIGLFMHDTGFPDPQILDMQLAIEEAVTNSIRHGYRGNPGDITIHCESGPELMTVVIIDNAPAFNPLSMPQPDTSSPLEERKTGGLGIYLLRQVTDSVAYRYESGKNILTLTKRKKNTGF